MGLNVGGVTDASGCGRSSKLSRLHFLAKGLEEAGSLSDVETIAGRKA